MEIELRRRLLKTNNSKLNKLNIPSIIKRIYIQRGINDIDNLDLKLTKLVKYNHLTNIKEAVNLLINAIKKKVNITIVGDFDTDGATSTALIILFLKQLKTNKINFIIPNRFNDIYGLNHEIINKAILNNTKLIITVDNGISSHEGIELARKKGIKVLVVDHHLPINNIPNANVIVNPNLNKNSNLYLKTLSGVGVVFYLMTALKKKLINNNWFFNHKINPPKLIELLDLVALGTIADVSPMNINNRILVYQGLNKIKTGNCRPGIIALTEILGCKLNKINTNDISFYLAPIINAAGRMNDMSIGVLLLLTNNLIRARFFAKKLNIFNKNRKEIQKIMELEALQLYKNNKYNIDNSFNLILYKKNWHQGLIGIIASRIKDKINKPIIVFTLFKENILKGSGRSIIGINMLNILKNLNNKYPEMLLTFGGHAMAIGLTLKKTKLKLFDYHFSKKIKKLLNSKILKKIIWSDGELTNKELSIKTAELLYINGPWGDDFPEPIFDGKFYIINYWIIKNKHLKLLIKFLNKNETFTGIAFNVDIDQWINKNNICNSIIELAYKLKINNFYNIKKLQLLILYIRFI